MFFNRIALVAVLVWATGGVVAAGEELFVATPLTEENSFTAGIEGPSCGPRGDVFAVNFARQQTIGRVSPDGRGEIFVTLPGQSVGNGIVFGRDGAMYVADYVGHNVLRVNPLTRQVRVFTHEDAMHQPNDLAIAPDGTIYASDPDWKNGTGQVWRVDAAGKVDRVADGLGTANGIDVSPDGKQLYVNETVQRNVWAFPVRSNGSLGDKRLVIHFDDFGLDGMRCDIDGNLYVARYGKGTVVKLSPAGKVLKEIDVLGQSPSNVCLGGPDGCTAYVTEVQHRRLVQFRVDRPGAAWERLHGLPISDPNEPRELLLSEYKPRPTLHVPEHSVDRAKFPVIDIHSHLNDAGAITRLHMAPEKIVQWMDRRNVKQIVILTGAWGERLQRVLDKMVKPFPDRFVVFTQIDWSRIDEPDFGNSMAAQIRDSVSRGARGLKVTKHLSLFVRDKTGKLVTVDDRRLDPIWAECGKLGIPVAIHVGDPEAFFNPIDPTNERYEQLKKTVDFRFHGGDYPKLREILDALERVFARFPQTTFVSLHFGNYPEDLEYVGGILDKHPNVVVEFGARQNELGRKPRQTRKFFLRYSDRVLFGTDGNDEMIYPSYFRWLETDDDYFDYYWAPSMGRWKIYGLDLPDEVLEKVYHKNAERVFAKFKPEALAVVQPAPLKQGQTFSVNHKTVTLTKLDTLPLVDSEWSRRFKFDSYENPKLKQLREQYRLDEVVAPGKDEFEKQFLLLDWVNHRFKKFGRPSSPARGALNILRDIDRGNSFFCSHYGDVFVSAAASMGWVDRGLALRRPDNIGSGSTEHTSTEIWSNQYRKWVLFDPTFAMYMEKDGVPLSAYEFRQEWFYHDGKDVTFVLDKDRKRFHKSDFPVFRGRYEGFGNLVLDGGATNVYAFIGYIPNTNWMDSGPDYGHMFIAQDRVCDGTSWHNRPIPPDPAHDPYFPIDQAALTLTMEGSALRVSVKTMTPNFKTFQMRTEGGEWKDVGDTFTWKPHDGANRLEVKSVNCFGVDGPISLAEANVGRQ